MGRRIPALATALALAAGLTACDGLTGSDGADEYTADLMPLNGSGVSGTANFTVDDGGVFTAGVDAAGLAAGEVHPQHVHAGGACPTAADDADDDGLVDITEGAEAYGGAMIPLDDDLADGTQNSFPSGAAIDYSATVDLATLESTLEPESLTLDTRSVVVHGAYVANGQIVESGATGAQYVATLPVACGTIELTSEGDDGGIY